MQAILFAQYADERGILTAILQQAGLVVRTINRMERIVQDWPERPAELFVLTTSDDMAQLTGQVRQLRGFTAAPIVLISDTLKEDQHVSLLEAGVDLLIQRPYSVRILLAQVRVLLRRSANIPFFSLPTLTRGRIILDPAARAVKIGDAKASRLTQLEFRLLYTLMINAGRTLPAENIVEAVWGYEGEGNRELVRGLIQRLRAKIEPQPGEPRYILTEPGIGYLFSDEV
jgi:DNA-binding response OmpR family regulator